MKKSIPLLLSLIMALLATPVAGQSAGTAKFNAGHPAIHIVGRSLATATGTVQFDWPGVTITTGFTGTSCTLLMDDTKHNFYNIFIDNLPVRVIDVASDTSLLLATALPAGNHTLQIIKRTEGNQGKATFKGLLLDEGATLFAVPQEAMRKIEFIGNSITCGYGTEGKSKEEEFRAETENNYLSYAAIMARAFNAEAHMIAHSGQGVVRNYGDKNLTSDYTMPDRYMQVFDNEREPVWDFSHWVPDIVVINLGTNDFSTKPHPLETVFNRKYSLLLRTIREKYDSIPVFCIVGPMTDEPCYSYVKKMVEAHRSHMNDPHLYFVGIPTYLMVEEEDLGSSWHPNYSGQKKMAAHVAPVISSVTGWTMVRTDELNIQ